MYLVLEKKLKIFIISFFLMREDLDDGENSRFDMPWHVTPLGGHNSLRLTF